MPLLIENEEKREKEKRKTEKSGTESLISTALCHAMLSLHHNATITRLYPESEIEIELEIELELELEIDRLQAC